MSSRPARHEPWPLQPRGQPRRPRATSEQSGPRKPSSQRHLLPRQRPCPEQPCGHRCSAARKRLQVVPDQPASHAHTHAASATELSTFSIPRLALPSVRLRDDCRRVMHRPCPVQFDGHLASTASHAKPVKPAEHAQLPPVHRPRAEQFPGHPGLCCNTMLHVEPPNPGLQLHSPSSQMPWPEHPEGHARGRARLQSLPKNPRSQSQPPSLLHVPCPEQLWRHAALSTAAQDEPRYPRSHMQTYSAVSLTQRPCPEQCAGHCVVAARRTMTAIMDKVAPGTVPVLVPVLQYSIA